MLMVLQFATQQKDYWCGPACAQMLLGGGKQSALARKLKTNAKVGTSRQAMLKLLKASRKVVAVHRRSTVLDLRGHLPALVSYEEVGGEDHYAIALRVTQKHIILNDPWHGPNYRLPIATFNRRWHNPKLRKKYTGWFVGVR